MKNVTLVKKIFLLAAILLPNSLLSQTLTSDTLEIEEVVVTGSKVGGRPQQIPLSVSVVSLAIILNNQPNLPCCRF